MDFFETQCSLMTVHYQLNDERVLADLLCQVILKSLLERLLILLILMAAT